MKQILYKREKTLLTIVTLLLSILLSTIELRGSEQTVYKNSVAEGDSSIVHDPYWGTNINQNVGIVLVISSFNPETKSTASFIERLSQNLEDEAPGLYRILVEDLAARNFSEDGWIWKWRVQKLLQKYKNRNLRAIITVGQEAWAALIAQERLPKKVPIFGSHISLNGIELPTAPITDNWEPKWISATQRGRNLANDWAGGLAFNPLPNKTIRLIESLFPNTTDIAFTVDNTYGGQSMKAFIREHLPLAFTSLNLHFLDASKYYLYQLQDSVLNLPPTSAIVIATWKVNRDGLYFSSGSLESLLKQRKDLPVFTLSGKGIEDIAIGGYFPSYSFDPKNIISQFLNFERGSRERLRFIVSSSHYSFNNKLLTEYKLSQNQLPLHSEIINIDDSRLKTYRSYTAALILITLLLAILLIVLIYLFRDQGKLKRELEKNAEELIEAKERAEESNRLKSAFIANISHEIRTPLNSIIGFSNILSDSALSPQERDDAQKI
ncbi:MAG: histidine kinase dimerization/phospho-acceptor domain-containing protein, partial [Bacteroidales bacterium]